MGKSISSTTLQGISFSARIASGWPMRPEAGKKRFLVVDGQEHKQYEGLAEGNLVFSPDSRRVAYVAEVRKNSLLSLMGKNISSTTRLLLTMKE